jgi:SnoaL-like domain
MSEHVADPDMAEQLSVMVAASESGADVGGIASLLIRFSNAVDQRRPTDVADLFSVEGLFRPGDRSIRGRSAIEAFYIARMSDQRRRTRHLWSNLLVRQTAPLQAQVDVVLTNYAFEPAVSETALQMRIGNVVCRCEGDEAGHWRFVEHLYERIFATSLPLAGSVVETLRT